MKHLPIALLLLIATIARAATGPVAHTDRLRLIKHANADARSYPAPADFMRILERFPMYAERGWHADYRGEASLGYFGDSNHSEMGLRAMGNYIFVTALLATDPAYDVRPTGVPRDTLLARSRACLAYMTRAHVTGDIPCADGKPWGNEWQSGWWTARMAAGARLLWPRLTPDERAAVERVIVFEADRDLKRTPPSGAVSDTKSEENAWDSEVLSWAVGMFPQHPRAAAWRVKAQEFFMNSLSAPQDKNDPTLVDGKPVKDWVVTENIHSDLTIENHGAYHFCYMSCPLHSLTWAYEGFTGGGAQYPQALFHHYQDVWRWIKRTYVGEGRFAYLSAKDWPRYAYGLTFVLPVTVMAQQRFGDPDARRIERDRIALLEREQLLNADGSFYGGRFTRNILMSRQAEYETDTYANLALCYLLHRRFKSPAATDSANLRQYLAGNWTSTDSGWSFGRSPKLFASFSWRSLHGNLPLGLFIPAGEAHMAEWMPEQLVGRFDFPDKDARKAVSQHADRIFSHGFSTTGLVEQRDKAGQPILKQQISFSALPGEGIALVIEHTTAVKPVALKSSEALNFALANDIFNNSLRRIHSTNPTIHLEGAKNLGTLEAAEPSANRVSEKLVPLHSPWLNIDNRLGIARLEPTGEFRIHDVSGRNAPFASLQYETISDLPRGPRDLQAGDTALDSAYLLIAGDRHTTARLQQRATIGRVANCEGLRYALIEAPSGKLYLAVANLDGAPRIARLRIPVDPPTRTLRYTSDPVHHNGKWWLETQIQFNTFGTELREVGQRLPAR